MKVLVEKDISLWLPRLKEDKSVVVYALPSSMLFSVWEYVDNKHLAKLERALLENKVTVDGLAMYSFDRLILTGDLVAYKRLYANGNNSVVFIDPKNPKETWKICNNGNLRNGFYLFYHPNTNSQINENNKSVPFMFGRIVEKMIGGYYTDILHPELGKYFENESSGYIKSVKLVRNAISRLRGEIS